MPGKAAGSAYPPSPLLVPPHLPAQFQQTAREKGVAHTQLDRDMGDGEPCLCFGIISLKTHVHVKPQMAPTGILGGCKSTQNIGALLTLTVQNSKSKSVNNVWW